jgi:hypothetical protein
MGSRALEAEIDRLYQLPLDEFTPARNALAKGAGGEAARVRALSKPPVAAWAVNQLYWRKAEVWNALLAAAENAQRVQRAVLAGRAGDVRAASKVHDDAVERALRATLALLTDAGQPATDQTKHAIGTTLRALPGEEAPGRLSRTLQPAGFGILTGLSVAAGTGRPASPAPRGGAAPSASRPKVEAKTLTRARQADAEATRALRDAENAVRREEFEKVRTERDEQRAEEAVEAAREALKLAASELEQAEAAALAATRLREAAAKRALAAEKALPGARSRAESAATALTRIEKGSRT